MIYDLLAPFYDAINADIDYKKWADFIEEIFKKECKSRPDLVLDLGCGTGLELDEIFRYFPDLAVTGIDLTREMLQQLKKVLLQITLCM